MSVQTIRGTSAPGGKPARLRRLFRNQDGTAAIEFAMVGVPFLMFIFGLIGVAFYFFITNSVEKGMDQASRLVRTGQAQASNMTVKQFKDKICQGAGYWIKCDKLQVFSTRYPDWASVTPAACVKADGTPTANATPDSDYIAQHVGSASEIVIVTGCYKWEMTKHIPYLKLGNMNDKSMMLQSATAFRSEPFQQN